MNAEQFEKVLSKYKPNVEDLMRDYGYDHSSAERIVREYTIQKKKNTHELRSEYKLIEFINNYDLTSLNILDIRFGNYSKQNEFYIIGFVLEYLLTLNTNNGELVAVNISDNNEIVWKICKNSDLFLEVLTLLIKFDYKIVNNRKRKMEFTHELLEKLYPIVGGADYLEFYKYLLNID